MAKHKKIVKELKRPDQFVDFWTHAWQRVVAFVAPRQKPAIAAAVAVAVVVIGASIINTWDGSRHLVASRKLSLIQDIANADLLGDTPDPTAARKDEGPRFKTVAEREQAVLKELDQFLAGDATAGLKDEAGLMKGTALLTLARYDEALAAYQAALAAKLDARLRFLAQEGIGYAYEGKGDLDKAIAAFSKTTEDSSTLPGFYADRALYQKARLTAVKGDKPGAVTIYRQILTKVPDTGLKDEITDRLALIEAK
ncbi:MAG: tetratricopeptide repeat protein [Myxococcales bacterium]